MGGGTSPKTVVSDSSASNSKNSTMEALEDRLRNAQHCCLKTFLNTSILVECRKVNIAKLISAPSSTPCAPVNQLVTMLSWLFHDSKVSNRSDTGSEEATRIYSLAIRIIQRIQSLQNELRSFLKPETALAGVDFSEIIQSISSDVGLMEFDLQRLLLLVGRLIEVTMSSIDDTLEEEYDEVSLENCPDEGKKFYATLPGSLPIRKTNLLEEIRQYSSATEDKTNHFGQRQTDDGCNIEWLQLGSQIVNALISIAVVELMKKNMAKIAKNKKAGGWSLGYGRGVAEYAASLGKFSTERNVEKTTVQSEIDLMMKLLASENQLQKKPKVAKGCVDYEPHQMQIRRTILRRIEDIFLMYGAQSIDTPIFELKETLTGKYGEDQKLIYDLNDQGGEQLGLRYDLTVPFARYCATHAVEKMTRYHIGKVYRRDEPQLSKGRLREFYQCDVDIAGVYDDMLPEVEILSLLSHVLEELKPIVGEYEVRLSHRSLLDGMMTHCGVPNNLLRPISSAIDKLDKSPWEAVAQECSDKGLSDAVIKRLAQFVQIRGSYNSVETALLKIDGVKENQDIQSALNSLKILFDSLPNLKAVEKSIIIDLSLARGLDYYTGLIYEASLLEGETGIGSIAAGGRYDNLIGMFSGKQIPAIGVSLGLERIFRMADRKLQINRNGIITNSQGRSISLRSADVFVCTIGQGLTREKNALVDELRKADIRVAHFLKEKVKLTKQLETILSENVPFAVIIGSEEVEQGLVKLRHFSQTSQDRSELAVPRNDIVNILRLKIRDHEVSECFDSLVFQRHRVESSL